MTTALFRKGGEMFLNSNGQPLAGGNLYYYLADTNPNAAAPTYADAAGTVLNTNPLVLDPSGRLTGPVYFGSANNYKELLTDSNGATISPWPFDNLPAAQGAPSAITGFERLYLPFTQLTSASSPVTLAQAAAGNGYECDATSGSIVINLPSAATANLAGTGYFFKRVDSTVAHSVTVVPAGTDTIDGVNAAISVGVGYAGVYLVSDGAQWLTYSFFNQSARMVVSRQAVTAGASLSIDMRLGWFVSLSLGATVTSFAVTNCPAAGSLGKLTLEVANTGAYNITAWPGTVIWPSGTAPTVTSGSGKKDTYLLTTLDGGTTWRGYIVAQAMA